MKKLSKDQIIANELFKEKVVNSLEAKRKTRIRGSLGWGENKRLGVTRFAIYHYASGLRTPTFSAAITVANYLKIDLGKLQREVKKKIKAEERIQ